MLLVTLVGSLNIYVGGKDYMTSLYQKDYNISITGGTTTDKNACNFTGGKRHRAQKGIRNAQYEDYSYQISTISKSKETN